MFVSIALAILDIRPHLMGGESDSLGMVAHRRAARCGDRLPDGFDCVRGYRAESVVAPFGDGDICVDNRVCVRTRLTERASTHDYVACHL